MRWSVGTKILIGVLAVTGLVTFFNLSFSQYLIIEDKKSYIYETGLNRAEGLSTSYIDKIKRSIDDIPSLDLLSRVNPKLINQFMESKDHVLAFGHQSKGNNLKWREGQSLGKYPEFSRSELTNFLKEREKPLLSQEMTVGETRVSHDQINNHPTLIITHLSERGRSVLISSIKSLSQHFGEDSVFDNYLFDLDAGQVILGNKDLITNDIINKIQNGGKRGTVEVTGKNNERGLLSYVKVNDQKTLILSHIPVSKAYSVVKGIIYKVLFFAILLLGIFMILALFFSSSITKPIHHLVEGTKWVSEGNFDKKVSIKSRDEFKILGNSFNYMTDEIKSLLDQKQDMIGELEEANRKLDDYSKNLETKVQERTKDLKEANDFIETMINSLDQGLFVFNKEGICSEVYTKACLDMFGREPANEYFSNVLGLDEKRKSEAQKWLEVTFSQKIPFSSAKGLAPKSLSEADSSGNTKKHIALNYFPMQDEQENLTNIVGVATDKTSEMQAIEAFNRKEAYVEMVIRIIKNKRAFYDFLDEIDSMLHDLDQISSDGFKDLDKAMLIYHSMNGGFGSYDIIDLQSLARNAEQTLIDSKDSNEEDFLPQMENDLEELKKQYKSFKEDIENLLESQKGVVEIKNEDIESFKGILESQSRQELLESFKQYFELTPFKDLLSSYVEFVHSLSEKLNKPTEVSFYGEDLRVNPEHYKHFVSTLVHLFRNSMDHGMETVEERQKTSKNPKGQIRIDLKKSDDENYFLLSISDDGKGIDLQKVREKLKNNPNYDSLEIDQKNDENVVLHIFDQGFSTTQEVTSLSGRGVGMSAIKESVDRLGGSIEVNTKFGEGSTFIFILPHHT